MDAHLILRAAGGLGLFLLGMVIMTEGLRALAAERIRAALMRFTRTPTSGAVTGAISTAILQSSSATTVAAVGFVGAGLMTFSNALGIIFGANLGTTVTGWLVALVGFKLDLGLLALPLVLLGALLKLFAKGRVAAVGFACAGFGLIFVGIDGLQAGLAGLRDGFDFGRIPGDTLLGRATLVLFGAAFTVVTQSSSAGVATALTAVHVGVITFPQAAALVIGMDVGTTVTAALATVGGSLGARRTGMSHVIYNLLTGTAAFALLTPYVLAMEAIAPGGLAADAELYLVGFHSFFNALGVLAVLPVAGGFARLVERLVPERAARRGRLDRALLEAPELALSAASAQLVDCTVALAGRVDALLGDAPLTDHDALLDEIGVRLDEAAGFLDQLALEDRDAVPWKRLVEQLHALDHLRRLHERCGETQRGRRAATACGVETERDALRAACATVTEQLAVGDLTRAAATASAARKALHRASDERRDVIVEEVGSGQVEWSHGSEELRALRWLRRSSKHLARITRHLNSAAVAAGG